MEFERPNLAYVCFGCRVPQRNPNIETPINSQPQFWTQPAPLGTDAVPPEQYCPERRLYDHGGATLRPPLSPYSRFGFQAGRHTTKTPRTFYIACSATHINTPGRRQQHKPFAQTLTLIYYENHIAQLSTPTATTHQTKNLDDKCCCADLC